MTVLPTDNYPVRLDIDYPPPGTLSRGLIFIKWLLVIPHIFLLALVSAGTGLATVIAWFAILFTGRYPRPLFDFIVGAQRWNQRATAYAFLLATDKYPPFGFGHPVTGTEIALIVGGLLFWFGFFIVYTMVIVAMTLAGTGGAGA